MDILRVLPVPRHPVSSTSEGKSTVADTTEPARSRDDAPVGAPPPKPTGPKDKALEERLKQIDHKLLVLSGKGGVGKSTLAVNLAVALSLAGRRVGLLDVDIHGPSIPKLLHLEGQRLSGRGEAILPLTFGEGLKVISIGFLLEDDQQAVIWRGPLKMKLITQFLRDVEWGVLDYLVVDSPPGTGDEPLSLAQLIGRLDGAIVVTTPQEVALTDVRKCINFCRQLRLPVLGVVENMSGLVCPHCGELIEVFGTGGGGEGMAQEMGVPSLGRIPLDPHVVEASDAGRPFIYFYGKTETASAFRRLAEAVANAVEATPAGAAESADPAAS